MRRALGPEAGHRRGRRSQKIYTRETSAGLPLTVPVSPSLVSAGRGRPIPLGLPPYLPDQGDSWPEEATGAGEASCRVTNEFACTPRGKWVGHRVSSSSKLRLSFAGSGGQALGYFVSVCRPATGPARPGAVDNPESSREMPRLELCFSLGWTLKS